MKVINWLRKVQNFLTQDKWLIRDMEDFSDPYWLIHEDCDTIFFPSSDKCDNCRTPIPNNILIQLRLLNGK